mmetsp:Transcript_1045/g.3264  ORF Transcript_1045/g.3264 Transcript_1045/m.3264 type:complete len:243 (-) Transcript_1045:472-1200(-)
MTKTYGCASLDGVAARAWVDLWNLVLLVLDVGKPVRGPKPSAWRRLVLGRDLWPHAVGQDVHVRPGGLVPQNLPLVLSTDVDLLRAPNAGSELDLLRGLLLRLRLRSQTRLRLVRARPGSLEVRRLHARRTLSHVITLGLSREGELCRVSQPPRCRLEIPGRGSAKVVAEVLLRVAPPVRGREPPLLGVRFGGHGLLANAARHLILAWPRGLVGLVPALPVPLSEHERRGALAVRHDLLAHR